jgi:3-hydroxybutyryl-CoA dehydrogenase
MSEIRRITVVGAGQMGAGIAQTAAVGGFDVTLSDVAPRQLEQAVSGIEASLAKLTEKGRRTRRRATPRSGGSDAAEPADADLLIEAATENVELKLRIFGQLDELAGEGAILASNTSSIPITRLAAATKRPQRVVGMHFMNPVPLMQLVEVIRGLETSDETVSSVVAAAEAMGKTVAEANDYPGFISNRILVPMINEAVYCLMEGVGDRESIDTVMKLGMNHPMGPLTLADLIGLDTCLAIMEVLHDGLGTTSTGPAALRSYVEAGRLGRKSGAASTSTEMGSAARAIEPIPILFT